MAVLIRDQMQISITASPDGSVDYVRIRGDVDLSDVRGLDVASQRLIAGGAGLVYVDLGGITFMGSTLVGFLVQVADSGRVRRPVVLCRPTAMARRVIDLTDLAELVSVRPDLPSWPDGAGVPDGGGVPVPR
jgi:anti-anti-sigma factor